MASRATNHHTSHQINLGKRHCGLEKGRIQNIHTHVTVNTIWTSRIPIPHFENCYTERIMTWEDSPYKMPSENSMIQTRHCMILNFVKRKKVQNSSPKITFIHISSSNIYKDDYIQMLAYLLSVGKIIGNSYFLLYFSIFS